MTLLALPCCREKSIAAKLACAELTLESRFSDSGICSFYEYKNDTLKNFIQEINLILNHPNSSDQCKCSAN